MDFLEISINGQKVRAQEGDTVLAASTRAGIYIPSLCFHPALPPGELRAEKVIYQNGAPIENEGGDVLPPCGLCLVQVEGMSELLRACDTPAIDGMIVTTQNQEINDRRKKALTELLRYHPNICMTCDRDPRCPPFGVCVRSAGVPKRCVACPGYGTCEFLEVADYVGMTGRTIPYSTEEAEGGSQNPFFEFDPALCVGCARCVRLCRDVRGVGVLGFVLNRGRVRIGAKDPVYNDAGCRFCMGCVDVCPTGALSDKKLKGRRAKDPGERLDQLVPCRGACPLHVDIPLYIYYISQRRYDDALDVIESKLPFPLLCGTICTHPCELSCRRADMDEAIAIRDLKRFVAKRRRDLPDRQAAPPSSKQIAIIGSGPAGLAAGYLLAVKGGHSVKIFEAKNVPGGMLSACIPRFRLPQDVVDFEIDRVIRAGVEIALSSEIRAIEPLFGDGFQAVLVATGAHREKRPGIEGENRQAVMGALSFLKKVHTGSTFELGKKVVVIGGGNVALDAARTARRLGAEDVTIVYRRSKAEMPANGEETARAEVEGVKFMFLAAPVRITSGDESTRLHLMKTRLRGKDRSGRPRVFPVNGSNFYKDVDTVIHAVGQAPEIPPDFGLEAEGVARIGLAPYQVSTSATGVFAAGDVVGGPGNIAEAIAMGIRAADAIDRFLGGNGLDSVGETRIGHIPPELNQDENFPHRRFQTDFLPLGKCLTGFETVELGFCEEKAVREANRCLRCSLRVGLSQMEFAKTAQSKE